VETQRWKKYFASFLHSAAEDEGIFISLTQHLFHLIAKDIRNWHVTVHFPLGVNVAAGHLMNESFTNDVMSFHEKLSASIILVVEITERSLIDDPKVASEKLDEIRHKGCKVAVDDFGTGYCSLSLLQSLPLDYLKIDKSFIDTLTSARADTPVLDTIVNLSKRLGLITVAEGISSEVKWNGFWEIRFLICKDFIRRDLWQQLIFSMVPNEKYS